MSDSQYNSILEEKDPMEIIYRHADRRLQYISIFCGLFGIALGFIHQMGLFSVIAMTGWVVVVFLALRIKNRQTQLGLTSMLMVLFVAWFLVFSRGLVEARYSYFIISFILVIYRNRTAVIVPIVTAMVFLLAMILNIWSPNWILNEFITNYILETSGQTEKRMLLTVFLVLTNGGVTFWLAAHFEDKTRNLLEEEIVQQRLLKQLDRNVQVAEGIANGNLSEVEEGDEGDMLAEALERMRQSLSMAREKEEKDRFFNGGMNQASEILRHQENGLIALCDEVLQFLIEYLNGNQGGIFLLEEDPDDPKKRHLEMYACYAYDRKKYMRQRVELGQGLVGQTFLEGKRSYLKKIPENYLQIRSGLGSAPPRNLLLVPMSTTEGVKGVLELATFEEFEEHHILFAEQVANSMASTFEVVKINDQTRELLTETRSNAEEMRAQEEEMRQNMEEFQATEEEMKRKEQRYQKQIEDLKASHAYEILRMKRDLADARDMLQQARAQANSE